MRRSKISWCDFSGQEANFTIGCSPVSEGCQQCYARRWADRAGIDFSQVQTYPDKLARLLSWKFTPQPFVRGNGRPLVFVCDLSDLFHALVPTEFIIDAFEIMSARLNVDWIVLTKRPERMISVLFGAEGNYYLGGGDYFSNIVLGVTAENQTRADQRIPLLTDNWMGPTMVSVEPMLERVDLTTELWLPHSISWVIVGAESGPHRRAFDVIWAEALYEQCQAAGVPFFGKQASGLRPGVPLLIGGRELKEWPK